MEYGMARARKRGDLRPAGAAAAAEPARVAA